MVWFCVDDKSHGHPKVLAAGNAAWGLFVRCGAYSSDQLTDGLIPHVIVQAYGKPAEIKRLLELGLMEYHSTGYRMPDFLDFNPSAASVKARNAKSAERQRAYRERHVSNAVTNGVSDDVSNSDRHASLARAGSLSLPQIDNGCTESSVSQTCAPTDDDDFALAIELIVDAKAEAHPPKSNPKRWRQVTRANTIAEEGNVIKALLDEHETVEQIIRRWSLSSVLVGHTHHHPDDCAVCDGGFVMELDEAGVERYRPCSERIVAP